EWRGLGYPTSPVPNNAINYADSTTFMADSRETDELGRFTSNDWVIHPSFYDPANHMDVFIPVDTKDNPQLPWFRKMNVEVEVVATEDLLYEFSMEACEMMCCSDEDLWDMVYALSEHPWYNQDIKCPVPFDGNTLNGTFMSAVEAQGVAVQAKCACLQLVGWILWWTIIVCNWSRHIKQHVEAAISELLWPKARRRGVIVSLCCDWCEVNFPLLICNYVPVFYIWGMFESSKPRFHQLAPHILENY
ncbi:hypothetical protein B0H17DRAFT_911684, partial [Mycena rosella]